MYEDAIAIKIGDKAKITADTIGVSFFPPLQ